MGGPAWITHIRPTSPFLALSPLCTSVLAAHRRRAVAPGISPSPSTVISPYPSTACCPYTTHTPRGNKTPPHITHIHPPCWQVREASRHASEAQAKAVEEALRARERVEGDQEALHAKVRPSPFSPFFLLQNT